MSTIEKLYKEFQDLATNTQTLEYKDVVSDVNFALALGLYDLWAVEKNKPESLPQKSMFMPETIGPVFMPHMVILDALDNGDDFHWRLFGTRHREEYGIDLTRHYVNDLIGEGNPAVETLKDMLQRCYTQQDAVFYKFNYVNEGEILRKSCGVLLPLWDEDHKDIIHIMSVTDWL